MPVDHWGRPTHISAEEFERLEDVTPAAGSRRSADLIDAPVRTGADGVDHPRGRRDVETVTATLQPLNSRGWQAISADTGQPILFYLIPLREDVIGPASW